MENLGWSRMAEACQEITDQYISRDTIKRRYLEAKAQEGTTANSTDQGPSRCSHNNTQFLPFSVKVEA